MNKIQSCHFSGVSGNLAKSGILKWLGNVGDIQSIQKVW